MATILVVDDDENFRHMLELILKKDGHGVLGAETGLDAIELAGQEKSIDIVITDQLMPGMTGTSLAKRLRLAAATRNAKIVVLSSSHLTPEVEAAILDSRIVAWLSKPIGLAELRAYILALLAGDLEALNRIAGEGQDDAA